MQCTELFPGTGLEKGGVQVLLSDTGCRGNRRSYLQKSLSGWQAEPLEFPVWTKYLVSNSEVCAWLVAVL